MELLCIEREFEPTASLDGAILDDDRLLHNLICTEERYLITGSYFKCLQTELKPSMREVVANWMLEVTIAIAHHYYCTPDVVAHIKKSLLVLGENTSASFTHLFPLSTSPCHTTTTFARLFLIAHSLLYINPLPANTART